MSFPAVTEAWMPSVRDPAENSCINPFSLEPPIDGVVLQGEVYRAGRKLMPPMDGVVPQGEVSRAGRKLMPPMDGVVLQGEVSRAGRRVEVVPGGA